MENVLGNNHSSSSAGVVMMKQPTIQAAVVELDANWSDIASWQQFSDATPKSDSEGNAIHGDVLCLNSHNSLILSKHRLVAALGCEDMVIVETADAVLVMPKSSSEDVRDLAKVLQAKNRVEYMTQRRVYRPWGNYEGLDVGKRYQVKRIVVNPGQKLSLQMHYHRAEHWVVVNGTALVTRGTEKFVLTENQSTYIPVGEKHRLENPGSIPLEIIEVQSGSYVGEDDIVRFEDIYHRATEPVAISPHTTVSPPRLSFPITQLQTPIDNHQL
jgi:mannose-1-phosphate guanylyltransferase/mannose-6-phosphate isomerase